MWIKAKLWKSGHFIEFSSLNLDKPRNFFRTNYSKIHLQHDHLHCVYNHSIPKILPDPAYLFRNSGICLLDSFKTLFDLIVGFCTLKHDALFHIKSLLNDIKITNYYFRIDTCVKNLINYSNWFMNVNQNVSLCLPSDCRTVFALQVTAEHQ